MTIQERLRQLMAVRGLNQTQTARRAGMRLATLNGIVNYYRPDPRLSSLRRIARALDVSLAYLLGEVE